MNHFTNVLLIDNTVMDVNVFVDSANSSTYPIVYTNITTQSDIMNQLNNFTKIERIGVVFSYNLNNIFLNNEPFFDTLTTYNENVNFIISMIQQFSVKNIDFLACNTLNYDEWVTYYIILADTTGVIVGASNDLTGNIKYGGDWVMESTQEDIDAIYFTESIEYYKYLLDTTLSTFVIKKEETLYNLYSAGRNNIGQLGLGYTSLVANPVTQLTKVTIPSSLIVKYIACGNLHTIFLMTTGEIYGTGLNSDGQLGLGNTTNQSSLQLVTTVPAGRTPQNISCGLFHTGVLMTNGEIYLAGRNTDGQIGLGSTSARVTSLTIMSTVPATKIVSAVACGGTHTILLMTTGELYGVGYNLTGQLGLSNTTTPISTLTIIPNNSGFTPKYITCGAYHTVVLMETGELYGFGKNSDGTLGLSNTVNVISTLTLIPNTTTKTPKYVACGGFFTVVIMTDGSLYGTGFNSNGQLGLTYTTNPITTLTLIPITPGLIPTMVSCGYSHTLVLMSNNVLYATGLNTDGQLANNNTGTAIIALTPVPNGTNVVYTFNNLDMLDLYVCFKEDSLILTDKGYLPIQNLRPGDLVKTLLHGFVPIFMIGKREIYHSVSTTREPNQLYVCSTNYPEVFEPLVLTGCHSILIEEFSGEEEKEMMNILGRVCITENKYRLPVCVDKRADIYPIPGKYTIYHIALENEDYYMNYGIYANGLLVETCSKRYLKELSNMELT